MRRIFCTLVGKHLFAALAAASSGLWASAQLNAQAKAATVTPRQVDDIVNRLESVTSNYVFPDVGAQLRQSLESHRAEYRVITDPEKLAERLTADMRAVGHDQHLMVTYGEELGVRKEPTPEEKAHAQEFDRASGFGIRSARRLPGNIGYVDLAYFSPDPDAGAAVAAAMRIVAGTDSLILDLRKNGGGSGDTMVTLASYFYDDVTQLSSVVERTGNQTSERQHWTAAYLEGPRYLDRPIFILTSRRTHSAAEALAYDLENTHRAKTVGEPTSGDATSGTGEISLGYGFSTFIANGQLISPVTHSNYLRTGVQPDVASDPADALVTAYQLALKASTPRVASKDLSDEKAAAIKDPKGALLQELNDFPKPQ